MLLCLPSERSKLRSWVSTTVDELHISFAMILQMGTVRKVVAEHTCWLSHALCYMWDVAILNLYHTYKLYTGRYLLLVGLLKNIALQLIKSHNTWSDPVLSKQHSRRSQARVVAPRFTPPAPCIEIQRRWMCRRHFICTHTVWHILEPRDTKFVYLRGSKGLCIYPCFRRCSTHCCFQRPEWLLNITKKAVSKCKLQLMQAQNFYGIIGIVSESYL